MQSQTSISIISFLNDKIKKSSLYSYKNINLNFKFCYIEHHNNSVVEYLRVVKLDIVCYKSKQDKGVRSTCNLTKILDF